MVTVDVEALPHRAAGNPLDELIWGRLPYGEFGIRQLMDTAERHGITLTMFLDYAEEALYGTSLLDVGREIHRHGHDLQLHLHETLLPRDFYVERGLRPVRNLNFAMTDASKHLAELLCEAHRRTTGDDPLAFRGGGYRYSGPLLQALHDSGVRLDSSYNASRSTQPLRLGQKRQFRWASGMYEVPISTVDDFKGNRRLTDYNFNASMFIDCTIETAATRHLDFLDQFYATHGDEAIAVLVMHSWSLLRLDRDGHFSAPLPDTLARLDRVFSDLSTNTEIVTATAVVDLIRQGRVPIDYTISFR